MPLPNGLTPLGTDEAPAPVGGDWTPSGMIGQWTMRNCFCLNTPTDIGMVETTLKPIFINKRRNDFEYHFATSGECNQFNEALGDKRIIEQVFLMYAKKDSILNIGAEYIDKFPDVILRKAKFTGLTSNKHRHESHLIALPSFVASIAKAMGYQTPAMDFRDLMSNQAIFDDTFALKMAGLGNDKEAYKESVLWLQRAAIWQALDETNAAAYLTMGAKDAKGNPSPFATTSKKLSECLHYVFVGFQAWANSIQVPDPKVDAVYGDESKRLTIPALTEIFASEKAAREVATEELKARADRQAAKSEAASKNGASVPAAYAGQEQMWFDFVNPLKENPAIKGKPAPMVLAFLKKNYPDELQLGATYAELMEAISK